MAPETSAKVAPPLVLTCHCTAGAGVPLAVAANVTGALGQPAVFVGSSVTCGAVLTVTVALPVPVFEQ